jgi:tetratricopeptide (TPR) repeat protein
MMRVGLLSLLLTVFITGTALAAWTDDFEKGKQSVNARRNDEAIQVFNGLIAGKRLPKDWLSQAHFFRGKAYKQKGDWEHAISDFSESAKLDPKSASAQFELGIAYHNQNKYDSALSAYDAAIKLKPGSYVYHYSRCVSNAWAGRPSGVITDCNKTLQLRPGYLPAMLEIGRAYEDTFNCGQAEDIYKKVLAADPGNRKATAGLEQIEVLRKSTDPNVKCKRG